MFNFFSRKLFVILRGGLGNQLFIYTAAQKFAEKNNIKNIYYINSGDLLIGSDYQMKKIHNLSYYIRNINIKNDFYKNKYFNFIYTYLKYKLFNKVVSEKNFFKINLFFFRKNLTLDGFFQNKKYFEDNLNKTLNKIFDSRFKNKKIKIRNQSVISISLYSQFGYTIPTNYYISALKKINIKKNERVIITTDDIWYGDLFSNYLKSCGYKKIKIFKNKSRTAFDDFLTIAKSNKLIMSSSSFCWWAAVFRSKFGLSDSKVVCPKIWLSKKNKQIFSDTNLKIRNKWIYL